MKHNYEACILLRGEPLLYRGQRDKGNSGVVFRTVDDFLSCYDVQ